MDKNINDSVENENTLEDQDIEDTSADVDAVDGTEDESTDASAEAGEDKKSDTVSLSKYMKLKKKLKEAEGKETNSQLSPEDISAVKQLNADKQKAEFEQAFDVDFNKVTKLYPEVNDRRDTILALSLTDKYKDSTLEEIVHDTFGSLIQKVTTEDEGGTGGDGVDVTVDFQNATPEQLEKVMANPEARKKYLDWKVENI